MSHELIIITKGTGPDGEATSQVTFTPSHELPEDEQFKRMQHAHKVLEKLNDFLYSEAS